jgi:hypothetical protein
MIKYFFKILILCFLFLTTCQKGREKDNVIYVKPANTIKVLYDQDIEVVANRNPTKKGHWGFPPTIILCENVPYKKSRVEKAARFWKNLGYEIFDVISSSSFKNCVDAETKYIKGSIIIKLRGQDFDESKYALTTTYRITETSEIVGVVIQVQNFAKEIDWVLEHELGHAFGWKHHNLKGHLMHQAAQHGGWSTRGLRNIKTINYSSW